MSPHTLPSATLALVLLSAPGCSDDSASTTPPAPTTTGSAGSAAGGAGGASSTGGAGATGGAQGGTGGETGGGGAGGTGTGGSAGGSGGTGGSGIDGPSCSGLPDTCGPDANESCCASGVVPAGTFPMGRCGDSFDASSCRDGYAGELNELPEHAASISTFRLDAYEATVGRFRNFVQAYPGSKPAANAGANPRIAASGWQSSWDVQLPSDQTELSSALQCDPVLATWTNAPGANEHKPINCIDWYTAMAFCAWDGGWLPSEAEWEKAAAGGDENRLYPWGSAPLDGAHAVWDSCGDGNCGGSSSTDDITPVGSRPLGVGRYGQSDLAGSMSEWIRDSYSSDWYAGAGNSCDDCANLTAALGWGLRGGGWDGSVATYFRAAARGYTAPSNRFGSFGVRCARGL